jgi:acetate kinase
VLRRRIMIILTVNTGSSSVRLGAFAKSKDGSRKIANRKYTPEESPSSILDEFIRDNEFQNISVIAHRVVHGGTKFVSSCVIDADVETEIDRLSSLAPLHNPHALKWIRACRAKFGEDVPQVAVFDTAFYSSLPEVAATYALPKDLCKKYGIRRYGFHGIAHSAMWKRWRELHPEMKEGGKVISLQLGAGCSMTAVYNGEVLDTSMGFSPLEGLVMATRSGDIDPSVAFYLVRSCGLHMEEIENMLNHSSGLFGISGISSDMRTLLESGHADARLAVELFCYRVKKYIGAYIAVLQGADAILFGGGVGENASQVRENIVEGLKWLGIVIDSKTNSVTIGTEGCISSPESRTEVWVIPVDEASILAGEAAGLIN